MAGKLVFVLLWLVDLPCVSAPHPQVITAVSAGYRPSLPPHPFAQKLGSLMDSCWHPQSEYRPSFEEVRSCCNCETQHLAVSVLFSAYFAVYAPALSPRDLVLPCLRVPIGVGYVGEGDEWCCFSFFFATSTLSLCCTPVPCARAISLRGIPCCSPCLAFA